MRAVAASAPTATPPANLLLRASSTAPIVVARKIDSVYGIDMKNDTGLNIRSIVASRARLSLPSSSTSAYIRYALRQHAAFDTISALASADSPVKPNARQSIGYSGKNTMNSLSSPAET